MDLNKKAIEMPVQPQKRFGHIWLWCTDFNGLVYWHNTSAPQIRVYEPVNPNGTLDERSWAVRANRTDDGRGPSLYSFYGLGAERLAFATAADIIEPLPALAE